MPTITSPMSLKQSVATPSSVRQQPLKPRQPPCLQTLGVAWPRSVYGVPIATSRNALPANRTTQTLSFVPALLAPFFTQRPFAPLLGHRYATRCRSGDTHGHCPLPRYYGLVRLLASLSLTRGLPSSLAELSGHAILLCPARALARRFAIAFGDLPSASLRRISFQPPKSIRWHPIGFMLTQHWPRGTLVTRLHERGSLTLSLIRSSGETRAHRSRTTLRFVYVGLRPRSGSARTTLAPPSERPDGRWISAFLTVCRLLYSNDSFHSFSSAEFCSAYLSPRIFSIGRRTRRTLRGLLQLLRMILVSTHCHPSPASSHPVPFAR